VDDLLKKVEEQVNELVKTEGVKRGNIEYLYKLIDVHKDIKNEEYWKKKEEKQNDEIQRLWSKRFERSFYGRLWQKRKIQRI
jgi:reverse gyrase